jgi:hypothetical protein
MTSKQKLNWPVFRYIEIPEYQYKISWGNWNNLVYPNSGISHAGNWTQFKIQVEIGENPLCTCHPANQHQLGLSFEVIASKEQQSCFTTNYLERARTSLIRTTQTDLTFPHTQRT